MNGELEIVRLAGYGGVWLAGPPGAEPPAVEADSWTFRYVGELSFTLDDGSVGSSARGSRGSASAARTGCGW